MTTAAPSHLEAQLVYQLKALKMLDNCEAEYRFAAHHAGGAGKGLRARLAIAGLSDWRFDLAWPAIKLAVEIEGGAWLTKSRHTTGSGFANDLLKYQAAMRLGWNIYRCDGAMIKSGDAVKTIQILIDFSK